MSGDGLLVAVDSKVHRVPAQVKVVALFVFVLAVVSTPAAHFWAFAVYGALLVAALVVAKLPVHVVSRRLAVETPFIVFACSCRSSRPDRRSTYSAWSCRSPAYSGRGTCWPRARSA